jgi:hypothetical protein
VVSDESEFSSSKICGEMIHAPNGSLHFQQKWGIVAFMFLQLSAGICNDAVLSIWVNLGENGPKATQLFVITEAGVDDEGLLLRG